LPASGISKSRPVPPFKATHKVNIDRQIGQVLVEVEEKTASLLRKCPSYKTRKLPTVASFDQS